MDYFELTYDKILETIFTAANPIKKSIISTQCKVHKYINGQAIEILKNDKYTIEYNFFKNYLFNINEGAVWADQDFKSSNHFYNPYKRKGLYGRRSAMDLSLEYYQESKKLWDKMDFDKSMFYFGATLHIIQDMTIPQHANIRLLDNHHQYENFIIKTYEHLKEFKVGNGAYILDSIEYYIRFNTRVAIKIHKKYKKLEPDEDKFYKIAKCGLPLAMRTTAGAMLLFYKDINKPIIN